MHDTWSQVWGSVQDFFQPFTKVPSQLAVWKIWHVVDAGYSISTGSMPHHEHQEISAITCKVWSENAHLKRIITMHT